MKNETFEELKEFAKQLRLTLDRVENWSEHPLTAKYPYMLHSEDGEGSIELFPSLEAVSEELWSLV